MYVYRHFYRICLHMRYVLIVLFDLLPVLVLAGFLPDSLAPLRHAALELMLNNFFCRILGVFLLVFHTEPIDL